MPNLSDEFDHFETIIQQVAEQLFNEKIKTGTIPRELYEQTASTLMNGVFAGLGGSTFPYEDSRNHILPYLRQNIYAFSGAKSLTQMQEYNDLLTDSEGKLRSFSAYARECAKLGLKFNKTWLATERNHAIAQAQMAHAWQEFQANDSIKYLEIRTAGDSAVRPWHASLDKFTAPKTDAVWRRLWPPFDWNCRCTIIPGQGKNVQPIGKRAKEARISPYFLNNSGLTKTVFNPDQTAYFNNVEDEGNQLTAQTNYNMPAVKDLYNDNSWPKPKTSTKEEAEQWWEEKTDGDIRGSFTMKDLLGDTLLFNNTTRKHIMYRNKDNRHEHVENIEDILKNPDEVWSFLDPKKELITQYIKYYEGYPYTILVKNQVVETMYRYDNKKDKKINLKSIEADRKGTLLYRKS